MPRDKDVYAFRRVNSLTRLPQFSFGVKYLRSSTLTAFANTVLFGVKTANRLSPMTPGRGPIQSR